MYSIFDLFKIGVGPSSSHTVGPMVAACRFARDCEQQHALFNQIAKIEISLYGSLALTGVGHSTDTAILAGLSGCLPDRTEPSTLREVIEHIRSSKTLRLAGNHEVPFDERLDLKWLRSETLPQHPNAMLFRVLAKDTTVLYEDRYFSTGGGFVYSADEFERLFGPSAKSEAKPSESSKGKPGSNSSGSPNQTVPYAFRSSKELLEMCQASGLTIDQVVHANEQVHRSDAEIAEQLDRLWGVMSECIDCGCRASGLLPGPLKVPRRAPEIFRRLNVSAFAAPSQLIGTNHDPAGGDPLRQLDWVSLFALAVNEENAAGGRVVTAPTNGAAGIIPAVLAYYVHFTPGANVAGIHKFLKTAGAIGLLYKRNASLSAAEMGCQGEVGVACSMAAAGLAACMNGTIEQIENAAEIGMEHNLGLTCDPIGGLVQVPCIERNTMGAAKAINAARLAVLYGDGKHFVSLDKVIETMRQTGVDMQVKYKETSLGGLAVNVVDC